MEGIIAYIESFSPFIQSLIAALTFAIAVWLTQVIKRGAQKTGSELMKDYEQSLLAKNWLHKNYVQSSDMNMSNHGVLVALMQSARFSLLGILVVIFFIGVNSIVSFNWFYVLGSWFAFNAFLEAYLWVNISSSSELVGGIGKEAKDKFHASLPEGAPDSTSIQNTSQAMEK